MGVRSKRSKAMCKANDNGRERQSIEEYICDTRPVKQRFGGYQERPQTPDSDFLLLTTEVVKDVLLPGSVSWVQ
eukprot:gene27498-33917_t